jgi:hypothetical protein
MEKEFIPYEQALALKELGFDEPCFWWYDFEKELRKDRIGVNSINSKYFLNGNSCSAPLYQQCFRWFREKYGYFTSPTEYDDDTSKKYDWLITKNLGDEKMFIKLIGYKNSYEEAELECLKKLIEIVKQNNNE